MASLTNGNGAKSTGVSFKDLPKSNIFTSNLPTDQEFPTPKSSYGAPRSELGPRRVNNALFTYVRPEERDGAELAGVSPAAMRDIGIAPGEESTDLFKATMAGNNIFWNPESEEGIYPWAQCYGGWQFGSWAGQLGDGRAISLFESTNKDTGVRYEIQLKGAGMTPYSRFADGLAVVRSSVREFIVSEALNGLGIPTTRALALTLLPKTQVRRERIEPGAIVCRFAQSWLRIGTYDLMRSRGDRNNIRKVSDFLATKVFKGWGSFDKVPHDFPEDEDGKPLQVNRYAHLYRHICRQNAETVAYWQAYGFTNGVLNTDNTSLLGLSLDFGPFAFIDNFDPKFTPNHDDHMLRYCYENQPSIIWWNLVRLGESLGELLGSGNRVDDEEFVNRGVAESWAPELITRAETIIEKTGEEYKATFMAKYKSLMGARLGLKTSKESDFEELFSSLLTVLEENELDFSHFFRRLSNLSLASLETESSRKDAAKVFMHAEGPTGIGSTVDSTTTSLGSWLEKWKVRIVEDWGSDKKSDIERQTAMKAVNPKFVPRGWLLDEIIKRVQEGGEREVLKRVMAMAMDPFKETWGGNAEEEERWCGEVPKSDRGIMCSCSS